MSSLHRDGDRSEAGELLRTGPHDRYFDYCLQPYQPRHDPRGRLRSENLLWRALEVAGAMSLRPPLLALQAALGRDMTVWGVKHDGCRIWLEIYVYDPQRQEPQARVDGLATLLSPWLQFQPKVPSWTPYMMVSFDLFADSVDRASVDLLNLYLTGTDEHAGRSYRACAQRVELENTYRFLPPKTEIDAVLSLLTASAFVDYSATPTVLSDVLMPRLFACKRICIAKKRHADVVYFSGIDVDQLGWFLARFQYPATIVDFVREYRSDLEHLWFDVGLDLRQGPDGSVNHPKTSFYGTL